MSKNRKHTRICIMLDCNEKGCNMVGRINLCDEHFWIYEAERDKRLRPESRKFYKTVTSAYRAVYKSNG